MVQGVIITESSSLIKNPIENKNLNINDSIVKQKLYENVFNNEKKIVNSKSLSCISEVINGVQDPEKKVENNTNDTEISNPSNSNPFNKKSKSLNELYFVEKTIENCALEVEYRRNRAISTGKIGKCVRFNDEIKITELNDEYDRRPMPLAKMYYKDHVELNQLREEMRQIQYRIINKIEGRVLLDN